MDCAHHLAGRCRSCDWIALPYATQLQQKQAQARAALSAHASLRWLDPVASPQSAFRNKAKMVVAGTVEAPVLGLRHADGREVDLADCALYPDAIQAAFAPIRRFITLARIAPYDVATRRGELKFVLLTRALPGGELMLRFVARSREPLARMQKHLGELLAALPALRVVTLNLQPVPMAVLEGEEEIVLGEHSELPLEVNGLKLRLRPQSFWQTNDAVLPALYAQARDWAARIASVRVWDLYCGVGGFALHLAAPGREVVGVERSAEAIASARAAAADASLPGVTFETGDATAFAREHATRAPDLVVVNPPRRGLGAELCEVLSSLPARALIYSSCNVESLAGDLARLPAWRAQEARMLDLFPHTGHFETIVWLERDQRDRVGP